MDRKVKCVRQRKENLYRILFRKSEGESLFEDVYVGGRIILKYESGALDVFGPECGKVVGACEGNNEFFG
jgi:hypothetical protein